MCLIVCLEVWCATDKLREVWSVEYQLMEEGYIQIAEHRGINECHEILQIFADPFEPKICESGQE
jgi:hypothetical protein